MIQKIQQSQEIDVLTWAEIDSNSELTIKQLSNSLWRLSYEKECTKESMKKNGKVWWEDKIQDKILWIITGDEKWILYDDRKRNK